MPCMALNVSKLLQSWRIAIPGLALVFALAGAAYFFATLFNWPAALFALALGFAFQLMPVPGKRSFDVGVQLSKTLLLKLGIVCMGARIPPDIVTAFGW